MPLVIEPVVQGAVVAQLAGCLSTQMSYLDASAETVTISTISYLDASAGAATLFGTGMSQLLGEPAKLTISGVAMRSMRLPLAIPDSAQQHLSFRIVAQEWKRETGHFSSMTKTVLHPAYQAIIGMGRPALPLIFEQLQRDRDHWLWALHAITQEDPARGLVDFDEAVDAWLRWGKDHGYL